MQTRTTATMSMTLALWACDSGVREDTAPCCDALSSDEALPETSIYQLESCWSDRSGKLRTLPQLRGQISVVAMIFTNCAFACPQTLGDLKAIEAKLSDSARPNVRFVLVSMDCERDTPAVLDAWGRENDLDAERWTLLHGEPPDVRELAATLGVKFKRMATGDFSHSNLITVLDHDGRIVHRQSGLNAPIEATVDHIESLTL